eukprot:1136714-Pelagomonas_calceolata.AAC.3
MRVRSFSWRHSPAAEVEAAPLLAEVVPAKENPPKPPLDAAGAAVVVAAAAAEGAPPLEAAAPDVAAAAEEEGAPKEGVLPARAPKPPKPPELAALEAVYTWSVNAVRGFEGKRKARSFHATLQALVDHTSKSMLEVCQQPFRAYKGLLATASQGASCAI